MHTSQVRHCTRVDLEDKLGALNLPTKLSAHVVARGAAQLVAAGVGSAEVVDLGVVLVGADGDGHRAAARVVPDGLATDVEGEHGAGRVEASGDHATGVDSQAGGGNAEHGEAEEVGEDEEDGLEHLGGVGNLNVDLRSCLESGDKCGEEGCGLGGIDLSGGMSKP
ncbi:hypothetical protein PG996_011401 [Apiospora saccharicola]|uniref:Uncharacterized protein n=1 Tax=Apiospora saccharicola TaxID=335842 RepID=A0ABR1UEY5_9PEZI